MGNDKPAISIGEIARLRSYSEQILATKERDTPEYRALASEFVTFFGWVEKNRRGPMPPEFGDVYTVVIKEGHYNRNGTPQQPRQNDSRSE